MFMCYFIFICLINYEGCFNGFFLSFYYCIKLEYKHVKTLYHESFLGFFLEIKAVILVTVVPYVTVSSLFGPIIILSTLSQTRFNVRKNSNRYVHITLY
jgi:hypothetical protein